MQTFCANHPCLASIAISLGAAYALTVLVIAAYGVYASTRPDTDNNEPEQPWW